jgi:hypothetical protein
MLPSDLHPLLRLTMPAAIYFSPYMPYCCAKGHVIVLSLTDCLTNYMKQCPSEANSSSAGQEVSVLCGTKVYCHVYESLPPFPVWSQMNHFLAPILYLEDPF